MSNNTLKQKQDPQCPMVAAYLLGQRHNASDLARKLGVSPNVLGNRLNPDQDFHKLGLGEAVAITELTNDNAILEAWAHQRGGVFVKLPESVSCDEELSDQLMRVNEEFGAALGEIRKAREDGIIDSEECDRVTSKLMSTVTEALALNALVKGQVRDLPRHPTAVIGK
ncbi:phage regulatory CII family protein [Rheinheimera sp. MMS21-TC3]|uniref:phage regulatory CII family protein n=1 Tax=Rheinheimera sp. MMS21-TC3 TaxID=3072790 RepID=UPI0028C4AEBF|nr:phage regulatory CII family protein [Rheinheimera sp. MMS21-TC3]WNO60864.1 phage regulatory CII family protein [Rheinheimera sp. MMS21-TC3]